MSPRRFLLGNGLRVLLPDPPEEGGVAGSALSFRRPSIQTSFEIVKAARKRNFTSPLPLEGRGVIRVIVNHCEVRSTLRMPCCTSSMGVIQREFPLARMRSCGTTPRVDCCVGTMPLKSRALQRLSKRLELLHPCISCCCRQPRPCLATHPRRPTPPALTWYSAATAVWTFSLAKPPLSAAQFGTRVRV